MRFPISVESVALSYIDSGIEHVI